MGTLHYLSNEFVEIRGNQIRRPRTRKAYLKLCKRFMSTQLYEYLIMALMDEDYVPIAKDLNLGMVIEAYWKFEEC